MYFKNLLSFGSVLFLCFFSASTGLASEASFPAKPIRLIVPWEAGSGTDMQARGIVPYMEKYLKTRVSIENIPGAGSKIGLTKAWNSEPDGYTLIYHIIPSSITTQYMLQGNFNVKDFSHIYAVSKTDQVLVVHADSWKDWNDFLAAAKSKTLSGGCSSLAGATHLMGLSTAKKLGLKVNWIPYTGGSAALTALAGKHLDFVITFSPTAVPLVRAGKVRPILMFADEKDDTFPQAPTAKEKGLDMPLLPSILGLVGPPNIPADRVKILEQGMAKVVKDPEFLEWAKKQSIDAFPLTAKQYHDHVMQQYEVVETFKDILDGLKKGNK